MDDPVFHSYCRSMGVIPDDAKILFGILTGHKLGAIDGKVLLGGMLRLRAGAKFMDIVTLMNEIDKQNTRWLEWSKEVRSELYNLKGLIRRRSSWAGSEVEVMQ